VERAKRFVGCWFASEKVNFEDMRIQSLHIQHRTRIHYCSSEYASIYLHRLHPMHFFRGFHSTLKRKSAAKEPGKPKGIVVGGRMYVGSWFLLLQVPPLLLQMV
jgi:hypothetical protein